ncbi:Shedu anti-phage system protein SduA domain-containing protein [Enterobacter roggenkampii]
MFAPSLGKSPYRGDDVFGPSTELGGAIAQILDQRFKLQSELPVIKNNMNRYDLHSYAVRCIVVAGMTPQEHQQRKSFELVRNAFAEIVIVTFDELLARLTEIKNALQPIPTLDTVPF